LKQKTAYEIPKRDWSSDGCSSDLVIAKLNRDYLRARVKEFFSSTGKPSKGGD